MSSQPIAFLRRGSLLLFYIFIACTQLPAAEPHSTSITLTHDADASHPLVLEYAKLLDQLWPEDLDAFTTATQAWHRMFAPAPVPLRDAAFRRYHQWHGEAINGLWSRIKREARANPVDATPLGPEADQKNSSVEWMREEAAPYVALVQQTEYAPTGIKIEWSEGTPYPSVRHLFYLSEFGALLSQPLRLWLELESEDLRVPPADDAAMQITPMEWGERLAAYEQYAINHPDQPEAAEARSSAQWYRYWFLRGMPNTPLFNSREKDTPLNDEFKRAFEWYLLLCPVQPTHAPLADLYQALLKHAFKHPGEAVLDSIYSRHKIDLPARD